MSVIKIKQPIFSVHSSAYIHQAKMYFFSLCCKRISVFILTHLFDFDEQMIKISLILEFSKI